MAARLKTSPSVKSLVARFHLRPHPEGGYFRETYRSAHCTAIYYLLPEGGTSRLHRIKSDELWHFYLGGPLEIVELDEAGKAEMTILGPENPQHVVPARRWFGARPKRASGYCFVGCTVAPAFNFADFELGRRSGLLREYPGAAAAIRALTNPDGA